MQANPSPVPFSALTGFSITASGGTPPYLFIPLPSPPNPPGVVVDVLTNPGHITVPEDTPPGTVIYVNVVDSAMPAQAVLVQNVVR